MKGVVPYKGSHPTEMAYYSGTPVSLNQSTWCVATWEGGGGKIPWHMLQNIYFKKKNPDIISFVNQKIKGIISSFGLVCRYISLKARGLGSDTPQATYKRGGSRWSPRISNPFRISYFLERRWRKFWIVILSPKLVKSQSPVFSGAGKGRGGGSWILILSRKLVKWLCQAQLPSPFLTRYVTHRGVHLRYCMAPLVQGDCWKYWQMVLWARRILLICL